MSHEPTEQELQTDQLWHLEKRLEAIELKLDQLIAVTEHAQSVVNSFLNGKNAKYLALFAKAKGLG